jgi:hypothetical protein
MSFTVGDVQLPVPISNNTPATPFPLNILDELVMIHVLSQGKGVEVHGCGLSIVGRAHVFVGQSGAGKSTLARLWLDHPGVTLLSDERVVTRTDRDRIAVWNAVAGRCLHFASPSAAFAAVFFLNQGPDPSSACTGGSRAAARLLACRSCRSTRGGGRRDDDGREQ